MIKTTVTVYGSSDDLVEVGCDPTLVVPGLPIDEAAKAPSGYEYPADEEDRIGLLFTQPDGNGFSVTMAYGLQGATWSVAISQEDEHQPLPIITVTQHENGYSAQATFDVEVGTVISVPSVIYAEEAPE